MKQFRDVGGMDMAGYNGTIIRAGESDAPRLARLLAWRREGVEPGDLFIDDSVIGSAASSLARPGFFILAAEGPSETLRGYLTASFIPKPDHRQGTLFVDELWVAPPYRRLGIARALLAETVNLGREIGAWQLRLVVDEENAPGRRLYARMGWRLTPALFGELDL